MKLSNIFNVDTSKGGGIKLFKKIIDKYNLGNEYKDLKTNVEKCSSGEGITYEYYKLNTSSSNIQYITMIIPAICMFVRVYDKREMLEGIYIKEVPVSLQLIDNLVGKITEIKLKIPNFDYIWDFAHELELKGKGLDIERQYFNTFAPTIIDELFIPISEEEYNKPVDL